MTLCISLVLSFAVRLDAQFVYTAGRINGANQILGFRITSTGALTPVPGSPFTAGSEPTAIVADPKGKYVYVVNQPTLTEGGNISGFRVGSTGELSPVPGSPFGRSYYGNPTVDVNGKFVFVTILSVNNDPEVPPAPDWVAAFRIGPSGSLEEVPGSPYITDFNSGPLVTDSTGQFLYIGIDDEEPSWAPMPPYIGGFKIESNGTLTRLPGWPFATSNVGCMPIALVLDPRGKYVYEFNNVYPTSQGAVAVYQVAADGALTLVSNSTTVFDWPVGIFTATADPKAGFVYTAFINADTYSTGAIGSAKIDAQGSLKPIVVPPFSADTPYSIAAEPYGKFLYATYFGSTGLWEYQIAADGSLTPIPGSPVGLNSPWGAIAIVPAGVDRNAQ